MRGGEREACRDARLTKERKAGHKKKKRNLGQSISEEIKALNFSGTISDAGPSRL